MLHKAQKNAVLGFALTPAVPLQKIFVDFSTLCRNDGVPSLPSTQNREVLWHEESPVQRRSRYLQEIPHADDKNLRVPQSGGGKSGCCLGHPGSPFFMNASDCVLYFTGSCVVVVVSRPPCPSALQQVGIDRGDIPDLSQVRRTEASGLFNAAGLITGTR